MPNLIKIGRMVAEIWRFNGFKMAAVRHLAVLKFNFLMVGTVKRQILHHRTKFRKDRSNSSGDVAIFVIFKMAAAAILDFQKFENLTVGPM